MQVSTEAYFVSSMLVVLIVGTTAELRTMRFHKSVGFDRIIGASVSSKSVPSRAFCNLICVKDEECNGYNFKPLSGQCEIITYSMSKQLADQQQADGWELWLPATCPDLQIRPTFTDQTVALVLRDKVVLSDIQCQVQGDEVVPHLQRDDPFMKADGDHRIAGTTEIYHFVSMRPFCSAICLEVQNCNGFNYNSVSQKCELITYDMTMHLSSQQDGWELWLPEGCPDLELRPSFTGSTVAITLAGSVLLDDIYCLVAGSEVRSYLNLQMSNWASTHHTLAYGSTYSKYRLLMPELAIVKDDFTFASLMGGYSLQNVVADVASCSSSTRGRYVFDLTGTSFGLTADVGNHVWGVVGGVDENVRTNQYAKMSVHGSCGHGTLKNAAGAITLELIV